MNTVYAQLVRQLDPESVVDMAKRLGIKSKLDAFCSITLGSVAVNNLEMTNAYSTLAAHGMRHRATPILEVTRQNGAPIAKHFSPAGRAGDRREHRRRGHLRAQERRDRRNRLRGRPRYRTATTCMARRAPRRTTSTRGSADTPQELSTCVWVGYPKEQTPLLYVEGVPAVYGGTIPAAIWHDYMLAAMDSTPEAGALRHAGIHRDARARRCRFRARPPRRARP